MFEKGTFVVMTALIALFIKLSIMPEVRRVREIVGNKNVHLKITPQKIDRFYIHVKNHSICINFFYRSKLITCSYYLCLFFTIASIAIGIPIFLSSSQVSMANATSTHTTPPQTNNIVDLDLTDTKGSVVVTVYDDGAYSITDLSKGTEMIIVNTNGEVLKIFEGNNIFYASIYFGILVGILCLVLAGPLKKIE